MKKLLIMLTLGLMFGQAELTTRLYDMSFNPSSGEEIPIDMVDITGYDLDYAVIHLMNVNISQGQEIVVDYGCDNINGQTFTNLHSNGTMGIIRPAIFSSDQNCYLKNLSSNSYSATFTVSITAPFPIEDTGYMEEDFDFCINEGLNLVSYPCENDIAINDALPSEISNNLSSIVGEGVAGVNVNGTWVGSLTQLQAGSGYWFKSSIEACFNYECAEN